MSVHHHHFQVHWVLLLILITGALGDLFLRWLALGRIESVALDVAIYTFLYSFVEWLVKNDTSDGGEWSAKSFICAVVVLLLTSVHSAAYRVQLQRQVRDVVDRVMDSVDKDHSAAIRALMKVVERAVPLTIEISENGIRQGKKRIRNEVADAVNRVLFLAGLSAKELEELNISENSFLISLRTRAWLNLVFFILGLIAISTPVVTIIKYR